MITTDTQPRGFDPIVERALILENTLTKQRQTITVQIGKPYWLECGVEAACPVAVAGLLDRRMDIRGVDPLNALELTIAFIESYLSARNPHENIYWVDGERYEAS